LIDVFSLLLISLTLDQLNSPFSSRSNIIIQFPRISSETCKRIKKAVFILVILRFKICISILNRCLNSRIKDLNRASVQYFDAAFFDLGQVIIKIDFPLFISEVAQAVALARTAGLASLTRTAPLAIVYFLGLRVGEVLLFLVCVHVVGLISGGSVHEHPGS